MIDEILFDFFDFSLKFVGRRRCVFSKGRKRKFLGDLFLGLDFFFKREVKVVVFSFFLLFLVAGVRRVLKVVKEKFNIFVERNKLLRLILSNEKCRGLKFGIRKRVIFSNFDDFFKEINVGKEEGGKSNK